jgi:OmpR-family two-component system manganese-sensing sensor histidine kinase
MLSYLIVFALILAGFGLVVHVAFVASLQREAGVRLDELARMGQSVVDWNGSRLTVSPDEVRSLVDPTREGLQWFDARGRQVASIGLVGPIATAPHSPDGARGRAKAGSETLQTLTVNIQGSSPQRTAVLRANISDRSFADALRKADLGVLIGFALALTGSLIAGAKLTHEAVDRVEASMLTLQEFTTDAAHELRGPLTAITTNASAALSDSTTLSQAQRDHLTAITSATSQMVQLTEALLILARANRSMERELYMIDLGTHVRDIVELHEAEAREQDLTLTCSVEEGVRVFGNPDQIDRIVGNLIENAIKYTPAGGTISVTCRQDRSGSHVRVVDTGPGIAPEYMSKIFERFWRADPVRSANSGAGLGLAIARALARRHGGDVIASSRIAVGSEFVATFPLRPPWREA